MALKHELRERGAAVIPDGPTMPEIDGPDLKNVWMTPEKAAQWLRDYRYGPQRPLDDRHIKELSLAITRDEFAPEPIKLARCREDGGQYLIDGQHRLMAVCIAERAVLIPVLTYHYETLREIEAHYAHIDQGKKRRLKELPTFHRLAEEHGLSLRQTNTLAGACRLIHQGFAYARGLAAVAGLIAEGKLVDTRFRQIEEWAAPMVDYCEAINWQAEQRRPKHRQATPRAFRMAPIVAVGIITFQQQKERAKTFWERASHMLGYEANTGEHHLVSYIVNEKYKHRPAEEVARQAARCWTAAYNEERLEVLRTMPLDQPIRIAGTTWDGKK